MTGKRSQSNWSNWFIKIFFIESSRSLLDAVSTTVLYNGARQE